MTTANADLYDNTVRHAADLRIHEENLIVGMNRSMRGHQERLATLAAKGATAKQYNREISRFRAEIFAFQRNALEDIASTEVDFHVGNLDGRVGDWFKVKSPKKRNILGFTTKANIRGNRNLGQQIDSILSMEEERISKFLKNNPDASGSFLKNGVTGTTNQTKGQLETLLATSSTQTQAESLRATMEANEPILVGYRFTAVLDSRTSEICAHHDGQVYDLDDKRWTPPLHWNCRSVLVPVTMSYSEMLASDNPRFKRKALEALKDPTYLAGGNPDVEDYDTWLRRQSTEVQLRHMNGDEEKLDLFQKGAIKLLSFTTARGKFMDTAKLRRIDVRSNVYTPIRATNNQPLENAEFKVDAYNISDLLSDKSAQAQLRELFIIDERHAASPLSATDFKGINLDTKRKNRYSSNFVNEEDFYVDLNTGATYNPLIYRPNQQVFQERVDLLNSSKLLTSEQKEFIVDFANSLDNKISLNNKSVVVDTLRVIFERQLKPDSANFGRPWENLTAVVRAELVNSVRNVSGRLNITERAQISQFQRINVKDKDSKAAVNIFGVETTFDDIAKRINSNQRYVDNWVDNKGFDLAAKAYSSGKAPLRTYFLPPSQPDAFNYKKKMVSAMDEAVDALNVPARIKKGYKEYLASIDVRTISEDKLLSFAREVDAKWQNIAQLEFLFRKQNSNWRRAIVDNSPEQSKLAVRSIAGAMKVLAEGNTTDYDALAIAIGKKLHDDLSLDFPWKKSDLVDFHKNGSRILLDLEKQGLIKVGAAIRNRKSPVDVSTGRPDPSGWKEVVVREVEIIDADLKALQVANRELYVGRRIGITSSANQLTLDKGELKYKDRLGRTTSEKAITKSASAALGQIDDALARHIDRDFVRQVTFANKQKWELDDEFTSFMEDVVYYRPRSDKVSEHTPNLFQALIKQRGEQGTMLFQTLKWHRQNGTSWTNIHQWDGRGRFYEQGYLAATRGEMTRPFLSSPDPISLTPGGLRELKLQIGATIGDSFETLTQTGRMAAFDDALQDILELGHIQQGRFLQRNRNVEDFLNNSLIRHVDDIDDANEIPKIARYSLEVKRIEDHLRANGLTLMPGRKLAIHKVESFDDTNPAHRKIMQGYKTRLMVENDASASGAQQIAIATGDRLLASASNVTPTERKRRLYDLAAMATVNNPRFQKRFGPEGMNLGISWKDLQKAAKNQNMVTFYGAGDATKTSNIEAKFAKVLSKNEDQLVIYRDKVPGGELNKPNVFSAKGLNDVIDRAINDAEAAGNMNVARGLSDIKKELNQMINKEISVGDKLLRYAAETDDEVANFVRKATNARAGIIGPKDFEFINSVMSEELAKIAPSTQTFIQFWKTAAKTYVPVSGNVDIAWVNYRGKELTQSYRPISETAFTFTDPITGRRVSNIVRDTNKDGLLRSSSSAGDVSTGLGVNGNHMNDASLVQGYWLRARDDNKRVATVHDGFFSHLEDADWTKNTMNELMADALKSGTIVKTLKAMRDKALENVNRQNRRERASMVDKLVSKANDGTLTRAELNDAFAILPGFKDILKSRTGLNDAQLSRKLGEIHKENVLAALSENLEEGFYSVKALNTAIKDVGLLEKNLHNEFGFGTNQILNMFAKHGNTRRLLNTQKRYEEGDLNSGLFFGQYFKEPALTPQESAKLRDARKNNKNITVSEALGKKPSPQEMLRAKYGIKTESDLRGFDYEDFFKKELAANKGALDIAKLEKVISETRSTELPDLSLRDVSNALTGYRGNLRALQRAQRQDIEQWYENMLQEARNGQLIDKNITNAKQLANLDRIMPAVEAGKFRSKDLDDLFNTWSGDLDKYWQITSLKQLKSDFNNGKFKIKEFIQEQNDRYRELTQEDMLRALKEGEDRYGIGP